MTAFEQKSFTVHQAGRDPKDCAHGWRNPKTGACVFCGQHYATLHGLELYGIVRDGVFTRADTDDPR